MNSRYELKAIPLPMAIVLQKPVESMLMDLMQMVEVFIIIHV
jgi:hypothetical protein